MKKSLNRFKRKIELILLQRQINYIFKGCPNYENTKVYTFNKFAYRFANNLIEYIVSDIDFSKGAISIGYNHSNYESLSIYLHEQECKVFNISNLDSFDKKVEVLIEFINRINKYYKCLNLPEFTNQNK